MTGWNDPNADPIADLNAWVEAYSEMALALTVDERTERTLQARTICTNLSRSYAFPYEDWWRVIEPWILNPVWPTLAERIPEWAGYGFGPSLVQHTMAVYEEPK